MADEDPFSVFDDDDEDEEVTEMTDDPLWAAQKLKDQANERMLAQSKEKTAENTEEKGDAAQLSRDTVDVSSLEGINLWPNSPPLYLGPMKLVTSLPVGGGRGFVATRDIAPGTLVLVEEPMIEWSDEQIGTALDLVSVLQLLEHPQALSLLQDMEEFHPIKREVDEGRGDNVQVKEMMKMLHHQHTDDDRLDAFVQLAKERNLCARDGSELETGDILRLLLALRYNGLESGVYRHVAMLNHDCHPNCVKFLPTSGWSEVRTTRHVSIGEGLTISYLPRIVSHATRRKHLWDQHRFDIGISSLGKWRPMEFIGSSLPASSIDKWDQNSITFGIETTTSQLEDHCREAEAAVQADGSAANPVWEEIKALEVASLELYTEATTRLRNSGNVILIPCLRLHLDACDLVQRNPNLTKSQRTLLLCRLVSSAKALLELQGHLFGRDHFDLARTNLEFAQAVEELLASAPKQVVQLGLPNMSTFEACSTAEHRARKEYERIRSLYPHDVETLIKAQPIPP